MKLDASLASVSKEHAYRSTGGASSKDTDGRVALPAFYHTRFRGINGALQWLCSNTRPDLSARVSLNQPPGPHVTREDLTQSGKILRTAQAHADFSIIFRATPVEKVRFVAFHDAGWGVRTDGSSQAGLLICAASQELLDGHEAPISLIEWKYWKLKRVCRSSLSSETQAQAETLDQLNYSRLFWQ